MQENYKQCKNIAAAMGSLVLNEVMESRMEQMNQEKQVASSSRRRRNPKQFWQFVNRKTKMKQGVANLEDLYQGK